MIPQRATRVTPKHRHSYARKLTAINYHASSGPEALRATVSLIGKGIREGARYLPLIQHARGLASRAAPKDYLGQLEQLYDDFTKRWRYVHDPLEVELLATSGPEIYGTILGADFNPPEHGRGDCDDATIYLGAAAEAISLKSRIVTISPPRGPGSTKLFSHVYPETFIPHVGWIPTDAVVYPTFGLGFSPAYSRKAIWDTHGNLLAYDGNFPAEYGRELKKMVRADVSGLSGYDFGSYPKGAENMGSLQGVDFNGFQDLGLENFGYCGLSGEPEDWQTHGLLGFGAYMDKPLPMVEGASLGLFAEYDDTDVIGYAGGQPVVRTKMFEMDPREVAYMYRTGRPRLGAVALGDDGDVYQWTEVPHLGGFFKKLFKKVKKGVKRVAKGIGKGVRAVTKGVTKAAKKIIKKAPGGKYLLKIGGKIKKVAMKAVHPILKIGKKLAPAIAMIPGYGPVIARALKAAPKMLSAAKKLGIPLDATGKPRPKTKAQARALSKVVQAQVAQQRQKYGRTREGRRIALPHTPKHQMLLHGYDVDMWS